tara:strand:- start:4122 stop:5093 length:972 start_codon:yes stop_codon:yes gene_type:complete
MSLKSETSKIIQPKHQLKLFGYDYYFKSFIQLFQKNKLPNTILLSGLKGSGKATFAYHFTNYLLSQNELNKYSTQDFTINSENKSYKLLSNNIHPNFFLLETVNYEENIKIDYVRQILRFLNKSTDNSNFKIVLIDNAEYLNINSSNALLKALEEPGENTFFFIIHNSSDKILDTIKSRCIEFKLFFTKSNKKEILNKILNFYNLELDTSSFTENLYFDTPGNMIKYLEFLNEDSNISFNDKLSCINYFIDQFKITKNPQLLTFISFFIEIFYNELSVSNLNNLNLYFYNKAKIIKQINDVKKFNLDKKNLFISLQEKLKNEK